MQTARFFLLALFLVSCETFPTNTVRIESPAEEVSVHHIGTEYVPVNGSIEGLLATKVNVLQFSVRVRNCSPVALECYGRLKMEGSPEEQEHSIRFRTDIVDCVPIETGCTFNTLSTIEPETSYTLLRPKFPTNEYAPFMGDRGKVSEVTITEVWAFDEHGNSHTVELVSE